MRTNSLAVKVGVVVAMVLGLGAFTFADSGKTRVTAYFEEFKGIYAGDDVTALGVPIGVVTAVEPEPGRVKVEMEIDSDQPVPADVRAAVVAPSLVSVRSVVLGPVGSDGPPLQDGATIPISRTAIPVEWDDIKDQLVELTTALGPDGANSRGATSDLVSSSARFLEGQGATLNQTLRDVSEAMSTLADNSGDLFATVRNLQVFVTAIKGSDAQMRLFNERLAEVASILESDRHVLAGALEGLHGAFTEVDRFLKENKNLTVSTLRELRATTSVLAQDRQQIADILQVAPTAVSNFYAILDPRGDNGSLVTGALAINNLQAPAQIICGALLATGGNRTDCQKALGPLLQYFAKNAPPVGINPLSNNGAGPGGVEDPEAPRPTEPSTEESAPADLEDLLNQLVGGE